MNCDIYRQIKQVIAVCSSGNPTSESRMLRCLEKLFFPAFCQRCRSWFWANSINKYNSEEIFRDAFNIGLSKVWAKGKVKALDEDLPTEATVIAISMMQLRGLVTAENRFTSKNVRAADIAQLTERPGYEKYLHPVTGMETDEEKKQEYTLVEEAFNQLSERCRQLLTWRKLFKLKNDVIAKKLGIDPGSVTNEVYRCMTRLKNNVDQLKEKIGQ